MMEQLKSIVAELGDIYIRELLTKVLDDPEIQRRLKYWQAGKSIHHAYQSGLLEHVLSCAELSMQLSKRYQVNESYVVAGAILHDLCKIYELSSGLVVDYTEEGKLVGHLAKGLEIIDRYCSKIKGFPYSVKLHLKHIILAHHGHYEYGSPKLPQTREAMLVHLIDFLDSKMHSFQTIIETDKTPGHWSGYIKHLDRVVYKNELPTYSEYLSPSEDKKTNERPPKKKNHDSAPKNNLGKFLKDFKIEE
jgi:3'-5' exoribonuclease